MPIAILDDIVYTILKKIDETDGNGKHPVNFVRSDFSGKTPNQADLLGHLDYLNQNNYIEADFSGNADAKHRRCSQLSQPRWAAPPPDRLGPRQIDRKRSKNVRGDEYEVPPNPPI